MDQAGVFSKVSSAGVLAVLTLEDSADAVPLAEALLEGGIGAMELTLRTESAIDSLRAIRSSVPDMLVGMGTVLTVDQVQQVSGAGASFAVSPGTNPRVVEAAGACKLPFAPGVVTPTDIEVAIELGCKTLKFFPAGPSGGLKYLRSMCVPYNHLGVKYMPLGGVNAGNLAEYLAEPVVAAVGGSWLAPLDLIAKRAWDDIRTLAQAAHKIVQDVRG